MSDMREWTPYFQTPQPRAFPEIGLQCFQTTQGARLTRPPVDAPLRALRAAARFLATSTCPRALLCAETSTPVKCQNKSICKDNRPLSTWHKQREAATGFQGGVSRITWWNEVLVRSGKKHDFLSAVHAWSGVWEVNRSLAHRRLNLVKPSQLGPIFNVKSSFQAGSLLNQMYSKAFSWQFFF